MAGSDTESPSPPKKGETEAHVGGGLAATELGAPQAPRAGLVVWVRQ